MARNRRIFWAGLGVGIASDGSNAYTPVHGVQACGVNTRLTLDQVYELGQLTLYENVEMVPDIEITTEKVLDGYPLIYHLATKLAPAASLVGRSTVKCSVAMSIYPDTNAAATGTPLTEVWVSGCFPSQISYNFPVEGTARESVTFVANDKVWYNGAGFTFQPSGADFSNDVPYQTGVVMRRQYVLFNQVLATGTVWQQHYTLVPTDIPGISASGTNDPASDGQGFSAHIQSIRVSANLGRTPLYELGKRGPYFRYVEFPVEVRTDYDVMSLTGDLVQATQVGILAGGQNVANQTIAVAVTDGTYVYCGTKNKLQSVNMTGGNAGARGNNQTLTFSYITFNDFTVLHPQDPAGFSA